MQTPRSSKTRPSPFRTPGGSGSNAPGLSQSSVLGPAGLPAREIEHPAAFDDVAVVHSCPALGHRPHPDPVPALAIVAVLVAAVIAAPLVVARGSRAP
jgi:hypothetical protein